MKSGGDNQVIQVAGRDFTITPWYVRYVKQNTRTVSRLACQRMIPRFRGETSCASNGDAFMRDNTKQLTPAFLLALSRMLESGGSYRLRRLFRQRGIRRNNARRIAITRKFVNAVYSRRPRTAPTRTQTPPPTTTQPPATGGQLPIPTGCNSDQRGDHALIDSTWKEMCVSEWPPANPTAADRRFCSKANPARLRTPADRVRHIYSRMYFNQLPRDFQRRLIAYESGNRALARAKYNQASRRWGNPRPLPAGSNVTQPSQPNQPTTPRKPKKRDPNATARRGLILNLGLGGRVWGQACSTSTEAGTMACGEVNDPRGFRLTAGAIYKHPVSKMFHVLIGGLVGLSIGQRRYVVGAGNVGPLAIQFGIGGLLGVGLQLSKRFSFDALTELRGTIFTGHSWNDYAPKTMTSFGWGVGAMLNMDNLFKIGPVQVGMGVGVFYRSNIGEPQVDAGRGDGSTFGARGQAVDVTLNARFTIPL